MIDCGSKLTIGRASEAMTRAFKRKGSQSSVEIAQFFMIVTGKLCYPMDSAGLTTQIGLDYSNAARLGCDRRDGKQRPRPGMAVLLIQGESYG
jgi:hypothetical protein